MTEPYAPSADTGPRGPRRQLANAAATTAMARSTVTAMSGPPEPPVVPVIPPVFGRVVASPIGGAVRAGRRLADGPGASEASGRPDGMGSNAARPPPVGSKFTQP